LCQQIVLIISTSAEKGNAMKDVIGQFVYSSGDGISFYVDSEGCTITKCMSEPGIAETSHVFSIPEVSKGSFNLVADRHCDIGDMQSDHREDLGSVGSTKEEALQAMIEKVIDPYRNKGPYSFNVNVDVAKTRLEKAMGLN